MTASNVSHLGSSNLGADDYALFLKKWSGEILTTFEETNVMAPLHMTRSISSGKSAQFPVIGTASTKYHTPGDSVVTESGYLNTIRTGERLIHVDKMLTSSVFVAKVEELINHYDVRSIYSTELGRAMAKKYDETLLILAAKAAYSAADTPITGAAGGTVVRVASTANVASGANLLEGLHTAMQRLDEQDVPKEDRFIVVSPEVYYKLLNQQDLINRDLVASNGDLSAGSMFSAYGGRILVSNHIPSGNITATDNQADGTSDANDYTINLTATNATLDEAANLQAFVFHKSALGTVNLMSLGMESEYQVSRQGTLFVSKYALGHGILRPECMVAIQTGDGSAVDIDLA